VARERRQNPGVCKTQDATASRNFICPAGSVSMGPASIVVSLHGMFIADGAVLGLIFFGSGQHQMKIL
jgi:hypothetical protein